MKILLDAMGGDNAPDANIKGAVKAIKDIEAEVMLIGNEDIINLEDVKREVGNHDGVIWTPIISLKREDAARLGYDNADMWRSLIRSKQMEIAKQFGIPFHDFKWYGAYHNEGGHPHLHMMVYSRGSKRGFLTEEKVEKIK